MDLERDLSFLEIIKYIDTYNSSRTVVEGERILKARHIITCGISGKKQKKVNIFALCLQSSSIAADPHKIHGSFKIEDNQLLIEEFNCSCVAGAGGQCKHIAATLIFCNRFVC